MKVWRKGVVLLAVLVGVSAVVFLPAEGMSLIITSECEESASGPGGTGPASLADGSTFVGFVSGLGGTSTGSWTHQTPPCPANICDELEGALFGLCTAYCEAMDCDSLAPRADAIACAKVSSNFKKIAGGNPPPCTICANTFVGTPTELLCFVNGGKSGYIWGTGTWNGESGYSFEIQVHDSSSGNSYKIWVTDSSGTTVLDTSGTLTSGNITVDVP